MRRIAGAGHWVRCRKSCGVTQRCCLCWRPEPMRAGNWSLQKSLGRRCAPKVRAGETSTKSPVPCICVRCTRLAYLDELKAQLLVCADQRVTQDGVVVIKAQNHRRAKLILRRHAAAACLDCAGCFMCPRPAKPPNPPEPRKNGAWRAEKACRGHQSLARQSGLVKGWESRLV